MPGMAQALPLPKYHQIYLVLREQLHEGRFQGGLPGELALMRQFGVARVTIRRALQDRPRAGFVAGLGGATGDALFAAVAGLGLTAVTQALETWQRPLQIGGGVVLVAIGLVLLLGMRRPHGVEVRAGQDPGQMMPGGHPMMSGGQAFATALAACDPAVRNKTAVATKNAAKATLKNAATLLANKVYSTAAVTNAQKIELGIPPRNAPSPIPAPALAPVIEVQSVNAWTVKIRLKDAASGSRRGKPPGVSGASVFSYVGPAVPTDISAWKFEGNVGRTTVDVVFNESLASGTRVWLTAFWFNGRKQSGPACPPVGTHLQGGGVQLAA